MRNRKFHVHSNNAVKAFNFITKRGRTAEMEHIRLRRIPRDNCKKENILSK